MSLVVHQRSLCCLFAVQGRVPRRLYRCDLTGGLLRDLGKWASPLWLVDHLKDGFMLLPVKTESTAGA